MLGKTNANKEVFKLPFFEARYLLQFALLRLRIRFRLFNELCRILSLMSSALLLTKRHENSVEATNSTCCLKKRHKTLPGKQKNLISLEFSRGHCITNPNNAFWRANSPTLSLHSLIPDLHWVDLRDFSYWRPHVPLLTSFSFLFNTLLIYFIDALVMNGLQLASLTQKMP